MSGHQHDSFFKFVIFRLSGAIANRKWQIYLNHKESLENLEAALNTIVTTMANCEFYASIYTGCLEVSLRSEETSDRLADSLEEALPEFYAVVLVFAIKTKSYFDASSRGKSPAFIQILKPLTNNTEAERFIRSPKPFSTELRPYFTDITEKESRMKELAHMATMEGIKGEALMLALAAFTILTHIPRSQEYAYNCRRAEVSTLTNHGRYEFILSL